MHCVSGMYDGQGGVGLKGGCPLPKKHSFRGRKPLLYPPGHGGRSSVSGVPKLCPNGPTQDVTERHQEWTLYCERMWASLKKA